MGVGGWEVGGRLFCVVQFIEQKCHLHVISTKSTAYNNNNNNNNNKIRLLQKGHCQPTKYLGIHIHI